ncbi:unnamed protein product [Dovyalis caffra]|uniref:Uncharacterized protein n=1 Tax=Dovyalis caffra TaxID=77055 RepID=A0AAV1QU67_9ROSI|nr:unnamed protein product [Dovyalis caffra]
MEEPNLSLRIVLPRELTTTVGPTDPVERPVTGAVYAFSWRPKRGTSDMGYAADDMGGVRPGPDQDNDTGPIETQPKYTIKPVFRILQAHEVGVNTT